MMIPVESLKGSKIEELMSSLALAPGGASTAAGPRAQTKAPAGM